MVKARALALGGRTLLAMTCRRCGNLLPGKAFGFHLRNLRDKRPYVDRRCTNCKWGLKAKGVKING
jgi:RNase P subunit RPR2